MNNKLSLELSGLRKNYNKKYCLTYMLEKLKNTLDKVKDVKDVISQNLSTH